MRLLPLLLFVLAGCTGNAPQVHDLVLRNGTLIDGTGSPGVQADVAIRGDQIVSVGNVRGTGRREIDCRGLVIAPGFIDVHTHADEDLLKHPLAENFIRDGVTTLVTGNCGYGVRDVAQYFDRLRRNGVALNVATFIGHNTVLRSVKGDSGAPLTDAQLEKAREMVRQAMLDGAIGFSTGLIYTPGRYSPTEEIVQLAAEAGRLGGVYATHMRSESTAILQAIDEAVRIGRESGCRVQISHFKMPADVSRRLNASGPGSDISLQRVEEARAAGLEVWLDQYPYTASSTTISTLLPDWVLEQGAERAREILQDPQQIEKVLSDMREAHEIRRNRKDLSYAVISSCSAHPHLAGKNLVQAAETFRNAGRELLREGTTQPPTMREQYLAVIRLYLDGGASAVFHTMDEGDVRNILKHPLVSVASDSGVRVFGAGVPHPRGYGTNARVLGRYVRELGDLSLEEAIRKMTSMPAQAMRFADRGVVRDGMKADLVVFDPKTVTDHATFESPHAYSTGFRMVLVNGVPVVENEKVTGAKPGVPLPGPGYQLGGDSGAATAP
jgi:N-acyl-D-amino-acid deacylase